MRDIKTIGILIFDGAEEMDFVGPWEVLRSALEVVPNKRVLTVSERPEPIICEKGMRVIADATYSNAPALDVILVPGGSGARRQVENPVTVTWLRSVAESCKVISSVCTGTFLLVGAGIVQGQRVTTHHDSIEHLRTWGNAEVVSGVRFIQDGKFVTAAGVSSGIEMSLWLSGKLFGSQAEAYARNYIAYDTPPRSTFEVSRFPDR
jgi:transcriptional regulator GlxA family with amidase domain